MGHGMRKRKERCTHADWHLGSLGAVKPLEGAIASETLPMVDGVMGAARRSLPPFNYFVTPPHLASTLDASVGGWLQSYASCPLSVKRRRPLPQSTSPGTTLPIAPSESTHLCQGVEQCSSSRHILRHPEQADCSFCCSIRRRAPASARRQSVNNCNDLTPELSRAAKRRRLE